nr:hypothetical protein [Nitrospiraceae bacterium]
TGQAVTTNPPLAQPLVREGTLALKLADALKVGTATNEAEAESMLAAVGITPRNGWIADYPVTPDVSGELQAAVGAAADAGKLKVAKDDALNAYHNTLVEYGLSVNPDTSGEAVGEPPPEAYPDTSAMYDYYYDEGPPVVTYYSPPPDYAYLYSWVPYPFWWSDVWFPGFFVLGDFDVDIGGHGHRHGHHDHEFVSNHFRDHDGRMFRVDPAHRHHDGMNGMIAGTRGWDHAGRRGAEAIINRSQTRGLTPWLNRGNAIAAPSASRGAVMPATRRGFSVPHSGVPGRISGSTAGSPGYRGGAAAVAPSQNRAIFSRPAEQSVAPGVAEGRPFGGYEYHGERSFSNPSFSGATSRPAFNEGRAYSAPSFGGRSFSAPPAAGRGGGGWGGGGFSGWHGGGSFGGGRRR